jgi:hypothetical protein
MITKLFKVLGKNFRCFLCGIFVERSNKYCALLGGNLQFWRSLNQGITRKVENDFKCKNFGITLKIGQIQLLRNINFKGTRKTGYLEH